MRICCCFLVFVYRTLFPTPTICFEVIGFRSWEEHFLVRDGWPDVRVSFVWAIDLRVTFLPTRCYAIVLRGMLHPFLPQERNVVVVSFEKWHWPRIRIRSKCLMSHCADCDPMVRYSTVSDRLPMWRRPTQMIGAKRTIAFRFLRLFISKRKKFFLKMVFLWSHLLSLPGYNWIWGRQIHIWNCQDHFDDFHLPLLNCN